MADLSPAAVSPAYLSAASLPYNQTACHIALYLFYQYSLMLEGKGFQAFLCIAQTFLLLLGFKKYLRGHFHAQRAEKC